MLLLKRWIVVLDDKHDTKRSGFEFHVDVFSVAFDDDRNAVQLGAGRPCFRCQQFLLIADTFVVVADDDIARLATRVPKEARFGGQVSCRTLSDLSRCRGS